MCQLNFTELKAVIEEAGKSLVTKQVRRSLLANESWDIGTNLFLLWSSFSR